MSKSDGSIEIDAQIKTENFKKNLKEMVASAESSTDDIAEKGDKMFKAMRSATMKLAAEYRKSGMDSSEAAKKAWAEVRQTSEYSSVMAAKEAAKASKQIQNSASDTSKSAKVSASDAGDSIKQILNDVANEADKIYSDVSEGGINLAGKLKTALTAVGAAKGLDMLKDALTDVTKVGMEFEASMSKVQAVSGATGKIFEDLTDLAREYGASTVFSSSECAEALNYMGMAGWSAEQMTSGLPGVLNLAAASGEDLATTSDIVTDSLTAFGMQAEEAGHFADILATASSKSNTNVSMMGETFKYVAPVAGALGYSAEDVAVAVGLMANSGIKASQAGTSLRAMLSNLTEPTDKQAAALDALGISLTDSEDKMKTLDTLLGDMRNAFSGLDESTKASRASIIAGQEAMSGLLAIVNASDSDFNKLRSAIYECDGACGSMAKTMTDNLSGGLKELSSLAEDAQIEVYDAVKPLISDALPGIKNFIGFIKDNGKNVANFLKPIGGALQVIFALSKPVFAILTPIFTLAGKFTGAIGDFIGALAGAGNEVEDYNGTMKECHKEIESTSKALQQAKEEYGENSDEVQKLQRELDTLNAQYRKGGGDAAVYGEKIEEMAESFDALKESQEEAMNAIDDSESLGINAVTMLQKLSEKTQLTSADLDTMSKYADYLNDTFNCNIKVNYDTGELTGFDPDTAAKQIQDKVNSNRRQAAIDLITGSEFTGDYLEAAETYYSEQTKLRNMQIELDRLSATKQYDFNGNAVYANTERYHELEEQIAATTETIEENEKLLETHNDELKKYAKIAGWDAEMTQKYGDSLMSTAQSGDSFVSMQDQANAKLSEHVAEMQSGVSAAQGVIEEYKDRILDVAKAYDEAYTSAYNSFSGQFGLFDIAQADAESTAYAAQNALESQTSYWQSYNENLQTLRSMSAEDLGITQENFDLLQRKLSDGSTESAGLLQNILNNGDGTIATMANTLGELEEAKQEAARTAQEINFNLNEEMDKVKSDMETSIKELNLSKDAENSALETMHSYIAGITDSMTAAQSAAQSVVDVVKSVFDNADLTFSAGGIGGYVQIEGNAKGTTNSADVFIAGEEGPELVVGKKGSSVFPFSETAKIVNAVNSMIPGADSAVAATMNIMNSQGASSVSAYSPVYREVYNPSSASPVATHPVSVTQSNNPPIVKVYIGDEEIRGFVIDAITDANANSGGWSV